MLHPPLSRSLSHILSEQFSVDRKAARHHLDECNNDLAKAGQQLLQHLLHQIPILTTPSNWKKISSSSPRHQEEGSVRWEHLQQRALWIQYDEQSSAVLEAAHHSSEDCVVLEHMQTYIDMKSLRATDGNGTVSKVRRVSTTAATPSLPWKIDATEQQQQASTPRIVSMAHDVSLQRVVTGHDDGSVAIWQVDEASSNFSVLQRTPLTNGEKLLAGKKLCCVISSDIIYTLDQLLTIISIFNIFQSTRGTDGLSTSFNPPPQTVSTYFSKVKLIQLQSPRSLRRPRSTHSAVPFVSFRASTSRERTRRLFLLVCRTDVVSSEFIAVPCPRVGSWSLLSSGSTIVMSSSSMSWIKWRSWWDASAPSSSSRFAIMEEVVALLCMDSLYLLLRHQSRTLTLLSLKLITTLCKRVSVDNQRIEWLLQRRVDRSTLFPCIPIVFFDTSRT